MSSPNIKRGLIRAWLLFSLLWIVSMGVFSYREWQSTHMAPGTFTYEEAQGLPHPGYHRALVYGVAGIAGPFAALLIGAGFLWVVAGFKSAP